MELTFTEAAKGANKQLSLNIDDSCTRCDGKGSEPGTKVSQCHYCNGTGMVRSRARSVCVCVCVWGRLQDPGSSFCSSVSFSLITVCVAPCRSPSTLVPSWCAAPADAAGGRAPSSPRPALCAEGQVRLRRGRRSLCLFLLVGSHPGGKQPMTLHQCLWELC